MTFAAGQSWRPAVANAPADMRLVIGAIVAFPNDRRIVCCAVFGARQRLPDGTAEATTIPFVPMAEAAFAASVSELDGDAALPEAFAGQLAAWQDDPRGVSYFTVAFESSLDLLIARQMEALASQS